MGNPVGSLIAKRDDDPVTTESKDEIPDNGIIRQLLSKKMCYEVPERRKMDKKSYLTGLAEGEGCFCISFSLRKKLNTNIEVRPSFSISLNMKDVKLLEQIRNILNCGAVRRSKKDDCYKYEVRMLNDLNEKVIPHFNTYPLQGAKRSDFEKFAQVCKMMKANLHRSKEHLPNLIDLSYSINQGKRKYKKMDLLRHMTR